MGHAPNETRSQCLCVIEVMTVGVHRLETPVKIYKISIHIYLNLNHRPRTMDYNTGANKYYHAFYGSPADSSDDEESILESKFGDQSGNYSVSSYDRNYNCMSTPFRTPRQNLQLSIHLYIPESSSPVTSPTRKRV